MWKRGNIIPDLPANIFINPAPADLVESIDVSAGYLEPDSGVTLPIAVQVFLSTGGKLSGSIAANASGKFPTEIKVDIAVGYTVASGLASISKSFTVPVTPAGALLHWDVPNKVAAVTRIHFGFLMERLDTLDFQWELLASGNVVRSGIQTVIPVGGMPFNWTPNPNRLEIALYPQPDVTNTFRLWSNSTRLNSRDLDPFELKQDLHSCAIEIKCKYLDSHRAQLLATVT